MALDIYWRLTDNSQIGGASGYVQGPMGPELSLHNGEYGAEDIRNPDWSSKPTDMLLPRVNLAVDAQKNVAVSIYIPAYWSNTSYFVPNKWEHMGLQPYPIPIGQYGWGKPINQYPAKGAHNVSDSEAVRICRYTPYGEGSIDLLAELDLPPGEDHFFRVEGVR